MTTRRRALGGPFVAGFARRLELPGDALLAVYVAVVARQYLWFVFDDSRAAWLVAASVAALASLLYVSTRVPAGDGGSAGLPFWLIVVPPLVFVYSLRVAFPDVSFDVLNYRLFHAERALDGFLYRADDFFPTPAAYNPAPDMVTGLFRRALGYRLGTVVNLLALVWAARVLDKLLRPHLAGAWLRAGGVLLCVVAEHLLFEVNNYMADLLALPLLLEATRTALEVGEGEDAKGRQGDARAELEGASGGRRDARAERRRLARVAFLSGLSVAFKLTNAVVALPVVLLCAYRFLKARGKRPGGLARTTAACFAAFVAPLLPFSAWLYGETGSPFFPVYNGIFRSPFWPPHSVWDPRWGPAVWWEKLLWPVLAFFQPERTSELAVYSGRIALGIAATACGLLLVRRDARLRALCLVFAAGALLWSFTTGYVRYAFPVEMLAGVAVIAVAASLARRPPRLRRTARACASLLLLGLLLQAALACLYVSRREWAERPTVFTQPAPYRAEARYFLRDHSPRDFLGGERAEAFGRVDVWVVSSIKTTGLQVLLNARAPALGVFMPEYFVTREGRERFERALAGVEGRRAYTLAFPEDLAAARAALSGRGLAAVNVEPLELPFFSPHTRISLFLIEVARGGKGGASEVVDWLPGDSYHAEISAAHQPSLMKAGAQEALRLRVRNAGAAPWPSRGGEGGIFQVTAGDRWLSADGASVVNDLDGRTALPRDIGPGEEAELTLGVKAPQRPGDYVLEVDMVHEGVTWFHKRGSRTLRWAVRVEP